VEQLQDPWMEDGGPAFPIVLPTGSAFKGMTLRDWFAGQAILSMPGPIHDDGYADARAAAAYRQADAMIKARGQ